MRTVVLKRRVSQRPRRRDQCRTTINGGLFFKTHLLDDPIRNVRVLLVPEDEPSGQLSFLSHLVTFDHHVLHSPVGLTPAAFLLLALLKHILLVRSPPQRCLLCPLRPCLA